MDGKGPMTPHPRYPLLVLAIALPATATHPSFAADEQFVDPCEDAGGIVAEACREALDLLTREDPYPETDLAIHAVRVQEGWLYRFYDRTSATGTSDETACPDAGPLVLPQGTSVELSVTSHDDLYEWSVGPLGIDAAMIPGRVESAVVNALEAGEFPGEITGLSGSEIEDVDGSVRVVDAGEFIAWRDGLTKREC